MTFYQSKKWISFVERLKLERVNENGELICEYCGKPITKRYDAIGHHKIHLTAENENDANIAFNPDNVEIIHFGCHNKLHKRNTEGLVQRVYLVYGSPCAGKTTWVNENANDDDLILDLDRIWNAICNDEGKPNRLKNNVFGIRDCIIDQVRMRKGMWRNAFIIGGYPLRSDRDRLCELLRAIPIFIEATKEECLHRAENRPDGWTDYVEAWFDSYTE